MKIRLTDRIIQWAELDYNARQEAKVNYLICIQTLGFFIGTFRVLILLFAFSYLLKLRGINNYVA